MSKILSVLLICAVLFGMISCTTDNGTETTSAQSRSTEPQNEATNDASSETTNSASNETTEPDAETTTGQSDPPAPTSPFGIDMADLNDLMQPIFAGNTVKNETVMFLEKGDVKTLLYPIDTIVSVTSYDGTVVYEEGKDYELVDGKIKVLENSSIPCITLAKYYTDPGHSIKLNTYYNGSAVRTYWGEDMMDEWQVNVNYTHSSEWNGFKQKSQSDVFDSFIKKLMNGDDVTVIFWGDSITYGHNASWVKGYAPYQHSYTMLFVEALADLFDYTVEYIKVNNTLTNTAPVPTENYVAGTRGTITYINTAVAGWKSSHGVNNFLNYVGLKANQYGCDLLVIGFGMNDQIFEPTVTRDNFKSMIDSILLLSPDASVVMISTMMPNPNSVSKWYNGQDKQAPYLKELSQQYIAKGVACGVCDMTSMSKSVLQRKDFHDYSGNNINHPNDFFMRVYAQTLLQTVIGYENMD